MTQLLNLPRAAALQETTKKTIDFDNRVRENKRAETPGSPIHAAPKIPNTQILQNIPRRSRLSERRNYLRHKVRAAVEVVEIESGQGVEAQLGNLGQAGCYVKTENPSPVGTAVNVQVTTATQSFRAHAQVVYSIPGRGMGLLFTVLDADELRILDAWLEAAVETSWLESNRRRSQRTLLAVNVQVLGNSSLGEHFSERTQTVSVSPHGAMVLVSKRVDKGQRLLLRNVRSEAEMECTAVHVARAPNDQFEVGLSFVLPNRAFWGVVFPPADWSIRHPDAKGT
jgi:PilZ domain-containing protein